MDHADSSTVSAQRGPRQHGDRSSIHGSGDLTPHILPLWLLGLIFGVLLMFTFITVAVTWVDLGVFALWVGLIIAAIKGILVVAYFMHLRYDSPFNALIFCAALLFLAIFIGGSITDTKNYAHNLQPPKPMSQVAR